MFEKSTETNTPEQLLHHYLNTRDATLFDSVCHNVIIPFVENEVTQKFKSKEKVKYDGSSGTIETIAICKEVVGKVIDRISKIKDLNKFINNCVHSHYVDYLKKQYLETNDEGYFNKLYFEGIEPYINAALNKRFDMPFPSEAFDVGQEAIKRVLKKLPQIKFLNINYVDKCVESAYQKYLKETNPDFFKLDAKLYDEFERKYHIRVKVWKKNNEKFYGLLKDFEKSVMVNEVYKLLRYEPKEFASLTFTSEFITEVNFYSIYKADIVKITIAILEKLDGSVEYKHLRHSMAVMMHIQKPRLISLDTPEENEDDELAVPSIINQISTAPFITEEERAQRENEYYQILWKELSKCTLVRRQAFVLSKLSCDALNYLVNNDIVESPKDIAEFIGIPFETLNKYWNDFPLEHKVIKILLGIEGEKTSEKRVSDCVKDLRKSVALKRVMGDYFSSKS